jgi:signal transduction histidine kinase
MPTEDGTQSERDRTDESLRVEREKADHALTEKLSAIDETADAVISRARERADAVLAKARSRMDRRLAAAPGVPAPEIVQKQRVREDQALRQERATADEAVRDERAEQVTVLAAERDETDKDLLSERARADYALSTRDEFLGIVSHDLRNILSVMVNSAALITRAVSRENHVDQVLRNAEYIQRSGARMNRLIGDLVDLASMEAGMLAVTPEPADPAAVVTEAVETFQTQAATRKISLVAQIIPPVPHLPLDPARILQVLTNLLSNAIKFTPAEGKVVVRLERVGHELQFAVSDTGTGVPANMLEAIFERYVQVAENDRRGVGLGLYISRCIVQGHGGRIWADSEVDKGTTVRFTLPLQA